MTAISACPQKDELEKLLDGSLSSERRHECMDHMESCECCQAKLEQIATGESNLSRIVKSLNETEPVSSSAYWPALKELGADLDETFVPRPPRSRGASLKFLQPAIDPAYLGRLAHFEVMRVIGHGGMGIVLEAFDSKLQRHVAVKVLDPELADDEVSRQRFCREARAAASISHENVVAVHQVEKSAENGVPYLVMQMIAGESLEQRLLRQPRLPLNEIVRIGMQAAHGLAAAHAQNLIHRDIKPGNILLAPPDDTVKLTDFGLARVVDDVKLTRTGYVTGTPLYMSPEQALGEESDPRSDLFSFGAILYEMCAGEPPFAGNSALAILKQIADAKHRPVRELNPTIPEWLERTIDKLLEKKPENRIQSAAHLAELFDYEWALMRTTSKDVPTVCKIEQAKQRKRRRSIAIGAGIALLAIGFAVDLFRNRLPIFTNLVTTSAEPIAVLSANSGTVWSVAFDPSGKSVSMGVEDGTVRMWDVESKSIKSTLNAHRGTVWTSKFCKDGAFLATGGDDGLIKMWNTANGELASMFEHPDAVRGLAFAHGRQTLFAGGRKGELRVWSKESSTPIAEATQPGTVLAIALSPDNDTLATAGSDKVVRLWNAQTLSMKLPLEGHAGPIYSLSFNQDGRRLASSGWDKTVRIWDTSSGQLIKSWKAHQGDVWNVAYSPNGSKLATGGTDGMVKLWNPETGSLLGTYLGHENAVHSIAFNQDGTRLASGGRDGTVRIWNME